MSGKRRIWLSAVAVLSDYEKTPSLRMLAKKYDVSVVTIKKCILEAGGELNFKKGSKDNYRRTRGCFSRGQVPWNKGMNMGDSFSQRQREIMLSKVRDGTFIHPLSSEDARAKGSMSKLGANNPMFGMVGELSPAWFGGLMGIPYPKEFSRGLKKQIRERDGYACAICGDYGNEVHHVDYDKNNNTYNNLITLCKHCHPITNRNREDWTKYFGEHKHIRGDMALLTGGGQ